MRVDRFLGIVKDITNGGDYYTGVPDSLLKALCDYLLGLYGIDPEHHIIAANEGNAVGLAAGYHLATGKVPVVYMQNSGEGNIINPVASLLNDKVYGIPCVFIVGWRGEPGVHDEPQHVYQGMITEKLLDVMGIECCVISDETDEHEIESVVADFRRVLSNGRQVAFVIRKGALTAYDSSEQGKVSDTIVNEDLPTREEIIRTIIEVSGKDLIISTTGKASRELFELREGKGEDHGRDFLTVGSMGHCSSIALSVAEFQSERRVWCIDGDGSMLMHMGALPVIAQAHPKNLIHVVINNGSHETVGGQPTAVRGIKLSDVVRDCGYPYATTVRTLEDLKTELERVCHKNELSFIEVMSKPGSRADLGRPTTSAVENKESFMNYLGVNSHA